MSLTEQDFTERIFTDIIRKSDESGEFNDCLKELQVHMKLKVSRDAILSFYNYAVMRGWVVPIELLGIEDKVALKDAAKRFSDKESGMDFCRSLHLLCYVIEKRNNENTDSQR